MKDEEIFTKLEEEPNTVDKPDYEENQLLESPFVKSLPNWDLEPPYETIKRGNKE